jgi:formylglycine-generating enzyme required for sulfatase activity
MSKPSAKPLGWFVGLGVLLITLGVIVGLIGIFVAAKRKQKYRIEDENTVPTTNGLPASVPPAGDISWTNDMAWIPGGTFTMASADGQPDERPPHSITVDGCWMDKSEVTNQARLRVLIQTNQELRRGYNEPAHSYAVMCTAPVGPAPE